MGGRAAATTAPNSGDSEDLASISMLGWSTEAWSAIATVGATVVALFLGVWPGVSARRNRPVLTMKVGTKEPLSHFVEPFDFKTLQICVEVANDGKQPALDVEASVVRWWHLSPGDEKWATVLFHPAALSWSPTEDPRSTVHKKSAEYVRLFRYPTNTGFIAIQTRGTDPTRYSSRGHHRVELRVVGVNTDPTVSCFEFHLDGESFVTHAVSSEPPANLKPLGVLEILDDVASTPDEV